MSSTDKVLASDVFVALATKNYLQDIERGDKRVTDQITAARSAGKPLVIAWVIGDPAALDAAGRAKLRRLLLGFSKSAEAEFDPHSPDSSSVFSALDRVIGI